MRRLLAGLAAAATAISASPVTASPAPISDLLQRLHGVADAAMSAPQWLMKATLYHGGGRGITARDSMGCKVSPMRTLAVDPHVVPRGTVVYIPETVGLPMPGGGAHDGLWYASDVGGAIKGRRIDLFTGHGAASMRPFMARGLSTASVTVMQVGAFHGCPPVA